jgi:hypothetical protein
MDDVTMFDEAAFVASMTESTGADTDDVEVDVSYQVKLGYSFEDEVSSSDINSLKATLAREVGVDESQVDVVVGSSRRLEFQEAAATEVEVVINSDEVEAVTGIENFAGNASKLTDALSTSGIEVSVVVSSPPIKVVKVTTTLKSKPGELAVEAPDQTALSSILSAKLNVEASCSITAIQVGSPTASPTINSTVSGPTVSPTYPAESDEFDSASMMGANALVFVTAGVAMSRST